MFPRTISAVRLETPMADIDVSTHLETSWPHALPDVRSFSEQRSIRYRAMHFEPCKIVNAFF
jgi:hypothetical protein